MINVCINVFIKQNDGPYYLMKEIFDNHYIKAYDAEEYVKWFVKTKCNYSRKFEPCIDIDEIKKLENESSYVTHKYDFPDDDANIYHLIVNFYS